MNCNIHQKASYAVLKCQNLQKQDLQQKGRYDIRHSLWMSIVLLSLCIPRPMHIYILHKTQEQVLL